MAKGTVTVNGNGKASKLGAKEFFAKVMPKFQAENKVDPKTGKPYKGVHCVYAGLNELIGKYYDLDKEGVRAFVDKAAADKIIKVIPSRGGANVYLFAEAPAASGKKVVEDILATL